MFGKKKVESTYKLGCMFAHQGRKDNDREERRQKKETEKRREREREEYHRQPLVLFLYYLSSIIVRLTWHLQYRKKYFNHFFIKLGLGDEKWNCADLRHFSRVLKYLLMPDNEKVAIGAAKIQKRR